MTPVAICAQCGNRYDPAKALCPKCGSDKIRTMESAEKQNERLYD